MAEHDGRPTYALRALERFAEYGDREAIVGVDNWTTSLTYARTRGLVLDLAATLRDAGYGPGMTVATLMANAPESFPVQLALHLLGCRTVWISMATTPGEIGDILAATRPDGLIYDVQTHADIGPGLAERIGGRVHCLRPGGAGPDLLAPRPVGAEPFDLDSAVGEPRAVFRTSGTTGKPKLIVHGPGLYEQMFAVADQWVADGKPLLRHLALTSMGQSAGQAAAMLNLISGGVLHMLWRFRPDEFLEQVQLRRANSAFITPLMFYQLLDEPTADSYDISSMTLLTVGGGPVSAARVREAVDRWGPIVRIAYGQSELPYISVFPGITDDPDRPSRIESCGPPHGDVRAEIRDEAGAVLPPGEVGELWVTSRLAFLGYLGAPELTERTLVDGWVRTRDQGHLDDEGYIHLVGRAEDLIITGVGSYKIFPRPIEDALTSHPDVLAAAVAGVPHETRGEAPHAWVVLAPGATVTTEELSQLVRGKLNLLWVPAAIDVVDELPAAASGKIDYRALKARLAERKAADAATGDGTAGGTAGGTDARGPATGDAVAPAAEAATTAR